MVMMRRVGGMVMFGLVVATLGCGDSGGGTTIDGGATTDGQAMLPDGFTPTPDGGTPAACNMLTNADPYVPWTVMALVAPTPMGGTIANGTYKLTAQNFYGSPGVQTLMPQAWTVVVQGTTWQQFVRNDLVMGTTTTSAAITGTEVGLTPSCPPEAGTSRFTYAFTASPTEIKLYRPGGTVGAAMEFVLTKQP